MLEYVALIFWGVVILPKMWGMTNDKSSNGVNDQRVTTSNPRGSPLVELKSNSKNGKSCIAVIKAHNAAAVKKSVQVFNICLKPSFSL